MSASDDGLFRAETAEGVRYFLGKGANVNAQDGFMRTPLIVACLCENIEVVNELLEADADVNLKDKNKRTALMIACYYGLSDIVEALLKKDDIKVDEQDANGKTALIKACRGNRFEIVRLLLDKGADVDIKDNEGHTASYGIKDKEMKKMLLEARRNQVLAKLRANEGSLGKTINPSLRDPKKRD